MRLPSWLCSSSEQSDVAFSCSGSGLSALRRACRHHSRLWAWPQFSGQADRCKTYRMAQDVTMTGAEILDAAEALVLRELKSRPEGLTNAEIEEKTGLSLPVDHHRGYITWTILQHLVKSGIVQKMGRRYRACWSKGRRWSTLESQPPGLRRCSWTSLQAARSRYSNRRTGHRPASTPVRLTSRQMRCRIWSRIGGRKGDGDPVCPWSCEGIRRRRILPSTGFSRRKPWWTLHWSVNPAITLRF